jgi:acyl-coenzyme A synthetase/AMP-(fatty) acid ligase
MVQKADSVGRVAPGIAVDIVDGRGRLLRPGAIGHVRCRGSGVSQRFFGPEARSAAGPEGFRDGSYYPADLGAIDPQGYLHLMGRLSDLIKRRGIIIYPPEIEAVSASHAGVAEAAVLGVPGASPEEQQVVAIVVARFNPDLEALRQHCLSRLPPEKVPDQLFWVDALPKIGPGKVNKPALRASVMKRPQSHGIGGEAGSRDGGRRVNRRRKRGQYERRAGWIDGREQLRKGAEHLTGKAPLFAGGGSTGFRLSSAVKGQP